MSAETRGRILVVDDQPRMGKALQRFLSPAHDVTTALSAREALGLVSAGARFDVILCDLMMPGMDGMALHAELRRAAPEQAERMVFMTGGAYTAEAQGFLEAVPNRRLQKPFRPEALERIIGEMLGGSA
ncbi:MAG TPA: response regulator [Anaeromyxobacteraceae bacterium]|nr:response regulator [Anaeromyxobacteraceae bacterium]